LTGKEFVGIARKEKEIIDGLMKLNVDIS